MKLSQIEIRPDTGIVQLRFEKQLFDDDGNAVFGGYHRDSVVPGETEKLVSLIGQEEANKITPYWTQEIIDAYQKLVENV